MKKYNFTCILNGRKLTHLGDFTCQKSLEDAKAFLLKSFSDLHGDMEIYIDGVLVFKRMRAFQTENGV